MGGLEEFRDKGYFFIDAIKLVVRKRMGDRNIPPKCMQELIERSSKILRDEIEKELAPRKICLMGKIARNAFLKGFDLIDIGYYLAKVTEIPPLSLDLRSYKIFVTCLPFRYQKTWEQQIRLGMRLDKQARL